MFKAGKAPKLRILAAEPAVLQDLASSPADTNTATTEKPAAAPVATSSPAQPWGMPMTQPQTPPVWFGFVLQPWAWPQLPHPVPFAMINAHPPMVPSMGADNWTHARAPEDLSTAAGTSTCTFGAAPMKQSPLTSTSNPNMMQAQSSAETRPTVMRKPNSRKADGGSKFKATTPSHGGAGFRRPKATCLKVAESLTELHGSDERCIIRVGRIASLGVQGLNRVAQVLNTMAPVVRVVRVGCVDRSNGQELACSYGFVIMKHAEDASRLVQEEEHEIIPGTVVTFRSFQFNDKR